MCHHTSQSIYFIEPTYQVCIKIVRKQAKDYTFLIIVLRCIKARVIVVELATYCHPCKRGTVHYPDHDC
jgi:hypothetical protein